MGGLHLVPQEMDHRALLRPGQKKGHTLWEVCVGQCCESLMPQHLRPGGLCNVICNHYKASWHSHVNKNQIL